MQICQNYAAQKSAFFLHHCRKLVQIRCHQGAGTKMQKCSVVYQRVSFKLTCTRMGFIKEIIFNSAYIFTMIAHWYENSKVHNY